MAYKVISTYVRPNTGVDFPKMSDHNSDHYDWVRQYFSDNAISVSFELSEDELTLIGTTECASRDIWETYRSQSEVAANEPAVINGLNADLASRNITIKMDADEDGTVTNILAEGQNISTE